MIDSDPTRRVISWRAFWDYEYGNWGLIRGTEIVIDRLSGCVDTDRQNIDDLAIHFGEGQTRVASNLVSVHVPCVQGGMA